MFFSSGSYFEFAFCSDLFADGNDFSWETILTGRNLYYQRQSASQVTSQMAKTMSLLSTALNVHLNVGQNLTMNTSAVFVSLETASVDSLSQKTIGQVAGAQIRLPSRWTSPIDQNTTVSLQVCAQWVFFPSACDQEISSSRRFDLLHQLMDLDWHPTRIFPRRSH